MPNTISLAEALANASAAKAANEATGIPAKRLTWWQRVFSILTGCPVQAEQQDRIDHLRFLLSRERQRLADLPEEATKRKHAAQLAYFVNMQQIDSWRAIEQAEAKAAIKELEAELELLESYPC